LLTDDDFRARIVSRITNYEARAFFGSRFEKWRDTFRDEAIDPVLNKVEAFLSFPSIKNILGQGRSTLHLSQAMQNGRIVIANLATGTIGETAARLFGALLLAHLRAAAMSRAAIPLSERRPFHLIADEAHSFGPASIARLLAETRKYNLSIILVTQFLDALTDATRAALLGNAKTLAAFRCSPADSRILARSFDRLHQDFNHTALQELADGHAIVTTGGGDATRVGVPPPDAFRAMQKVAKQSRRHYGRPRTEIEERLARALDYPRSVRHPRRPISSNRLHVS
jgi:hypothetical protein